MKLYVDMDGVLADFDRQHETHFGIKSDKLLDNVDWKKVKEIPDFYLNIPPMEDAFVLWNFVKGMNPTILTGVPSDVGEAANNKRSWISKHLGYDVPVITLPSKLKSSVAEPGDILIDDWEKYRHLWEAAGGRWITHTSAEDTIKQLKEMGVTNEP